MANDIGFVLPLVFIQKLFRTAESHLVNIFIYFFRCHPNTLIGDRNGLFFYIQLAVT